MNLLLILGIIGVMVLIAVIGVIIKLLVICPPNKVIVLSGATRTVGERKLGYRLLQGGRTVRIPLLERVDELDLTNMIIDIRVQGAYSKGGIPLNVEGVANVKIASNEPVIGNAIERLLRKPRGAIVNIARETLEGNLRGVLATLTPEEVNQDRVKFAQSLLAEADIDLTRVGIELDTLKIQNVSDDKGYLDSIGRAQSAGLIMRSRVAEAENKAQAMERSAANMQTKELARIDADIAEARADANRRIIDAQTRREAMIAEERAEVTAQLAKAQAEVAVQEARVEQVRHQLLADQIRPAEARRQAAEEDARGIAAKIALEGQATADALRSIAKTWAEAGDNGREIFLAQKLTGLVGQLMATVDHARVDKVTFIDKALTGGDNVAVKAAVASEQLKHTLGVDLPKLLQSFGGKASGAPTNGLS